MKAQSSASAYWSARRARDIAHKATLAHCAAVAHARAIKRNAVASVLPGQSIPQCLDAYPVIIHQTNGAQLVCRHLV